VTVELHHRIDGPAGAPVVVLSGSLGSTMEMWDDQMPALAGYRVVRYDHRGHGGSPVPPGPYTIAELGDDALALLDRLGIERCTWVGLSLGGMVGMALAVRAPERFERLVLACTTAGPVPWDLWTERAAAVRAGGTGTMVESGLERWLTPDAPAATRERLRAMLGATPPEGYAACCEAIRGHDVSARLGEIRAPTLVIAADGDPSTPPAELARIRDGIPGARMVLLEHARHLANIERPEAFDRALTGFLDDGMRTRREVLGDAHVDASLDRATDLTAEFQAFITRYAWGEIWTRPGLDRRTRSVITVTALVALGHERELRLHLRAARRNGLTDEEIKEVLLHAAIYCGVPAANTAFAIAQEVLAEP